VAATIPIPLCHSKLICRRTGQVTSPLSGKLGTKMKQGTKKRGKRRQKGKKRKVHTTDYRTIEISDPMEEISDLFGRISLPEGRKSFCSAFVVFLRT
jgi:hypothetical protein